MDDTKPFRPAKRTALIKSLTGFGEKTPGVAGPMGGSSSRPGSPGIPQDLRAVSDFHLIEMIGEGGMGQIYTAYDRILNRNVAVKRLNGVLSSNDALKRGFRAEALITGQLAHPNIIPIYNLIEEDDDFGIAMKLIEGLTLHEILHPETDDEISYAATFDLKGKIQILIAVCNPVSFAHSRQIIHRDIKPGNIMVGEFGEILLLDWGIALSVADSPEENVMHGLPHRSEVSGMLGSLFYMPPEMLNARGDLIGFHSDVYLLGAVLYEIVSGAPPHLSRAHKSGFTTKDEVAPPLPEAVDSELRAICAKALSPDVKD